MILLPEGNLYAIQNPASHQENIFSPKKYTHTQGHPLGALDKKGHMDSKVETKSCVTFMQSSVFYCVVGAREKKMHISGKLRSLDDDQDDDDDVLYSHTYFPFAMWLFVRIYVPLYTLLCVSSFLDLCRHKLCRTSGMDEHKIWHTQQNKKYYYKERNNSIRL